MISWNWDVKTLEAYAILEGLKSIVRFLPAPRSLIVESDALEVIKCLNGDVEILSEFKNLLAKIAEEAVKIGGVSFVHGCHTGNAVAHCSELFFGM